MFISCFYPTKRYSSSFLHLFQELKSDTKTTNVVNTFLPQKIQPFVSVAAKDFFKEKFFETVLLVLQQAYNENDLDQKKSLHRCCD